MQRGPSARRVCVLASGGLDSAVLVAELAKRRDVFPLYVRCGLRWEAVERKWLGRFLAAMASPAIRPLMTASLPVRDLYGRDHWSLGGRRVPGYAAPPSSNLLPGRNLLLLSVAAIHAARVGASTVALASLAGNPFADATPAFLALMARAASRALGCRLAIATPFANLTKAAVIRRGRAYPLHLSFSCLQPQRGIHCGRCTKCAERQHAFRAAGVSDPTRYATPRGGGERRVGRR